MASERLTKTELDRRIRHIVDRVERDHRTWPLHIPTLSWKGHLFVCFITVSAGFSGYFMSEFIQAEHLAGPPGWLISLTVALGMAWVFRFFTKLPIEDFAWAHQVGEVHVRS